MTGMAGATLRDVENGGADPTIDTLRKLVRLYGGKLIIEVNDNG